MKTQKHPLWGLDSYVRILGIITYLAYFFAGPPSAHAQVSKIRSDEEVVLSQEESDRLNKAIPKNIQILFEDEIDRNFFFDFDERLRTAPNPQMAQEIKEDKAGFERMGDFSPTSKRWFYLPYLEIPLDDIEKLNISPSIRKSYRDLWIFNKGGRQYLRYFLHPFRELQNYEDLVAKYPLVYKYVARPTSSPRSLIVIDLDDPKSPEWVKVSMHVKVTSLQRRQKVEKMTRALVVNESLNSIPSATVNKLDFDWLPEPLAVKLPGKEEIDIGRDLGAYIRERPRSTFSLFRGIGEDDPPVHDMVKRSGMSAMNFFKKYFIEPAIRVYTYLGFVEGIQWGMHSANYMTVQGSNGLPTGKIVLKDFDGAWIDPEMRALQGKSFKNWHRNVVKFENFLFPSATGRNSGPVQHFGQYYNRYIRNAGGFSSLGSLIFNYMAKYCREESCKDKEALKKRVQDTIDQETIEQIKNYTGLNYTLADMKEGHLKVNGLNRALTTLRQQLLDKTKREDAIDSQQDLLKDEFLRLDGLERTWTAAGGSSVASRLQSANMVMFYDRDAGMIQARMYRGKGSDSKYSIFGYAMIEDPKESQASAKFLASLGSGGARKKAAVKEEAQTASAPAATTEKGCDAPLRKKRTSTTVTWFFDRLQLKVFFGAPHIA